MIYAGQDIQNAGQLTWYIAVAVYRIKEHFGVERNEPVPYLGTKICLESKLIGRSIPKFLIDEFLWPSEKTESPSIGLITDSRLTA